LSIFVVSLLNQGTGCTDKAANLQGLGENEAAIDEGTPAEEARIYDPIRMAINVRTMFVYPKIKLLELDAGRGMKLSLIAYSKERGLTGRELGNFELSVDDQISTLAGTDSLVTPLAAWIPFMKDSAGVTRAVPADTVGNRTSLESPSATWRVLFDPID